MSTGDKSSILDSLEDLFLVFDENGTPIEWNQSVSDVTGYTDEELASMEPWDLFDGEDEHRITDAISDVFEAGEATVEADLLTADGERIPYEFSAQRLADDQNGFVGIGRDISEREAIERERREILNRMADALLAVDSDWRITYTNDLGAQILSDAIGRDLTPEELRGLHLWDEVPEAVGTTFYEKYHEAMETQEPVVFEEYYPPLASWFDVRAYPSPTGLSVYLYDITERYRQREALETRERVLREMYEIIADRHRPFTEQVEALLALGRDELGVAYGTLSRIDGEDYVFEVVDADDGNIQPGDVVPLSATNCEIAASTEQTLVLGDIARDAPDETDRAGYDEWGISCYIGAPVFVGDDVFGTFCFYDTTPREGQFSEWETTFVDLMARWVSYELERQESKARLERQNEKLDQFASIVTHDLRNPLNVLEGWLEVAEETGEQKQFERCYRAIERMNTLIDDLLTLARAGVTVDDTEPVELASVARRSWESVATDDATLRIDTDRVIEADETRLQQLLENLFRNAVEHGGESITLTVGDLDSGFFVEDTGHGIPAADRKAVFESGYTTSSTGTGFGLAIVDEIATAHGWTVRIGEGGEGGARFEFDGVSPKAR